MVAVSRLEVELRPVEEALFDLSLASPLLFLHARVRTQLLYAAEC